MKSKLGIRTKIGLLLFLMLLIALINLLVIYNYQKTQKHDTHIVNVAGRQRMLSQKMVKHALAIAAGIDQERKDLQETIELYEKSFLAMRNGGVSIPWGGKIKPPPLPVRDALSVVGEVWSGFKPKISIVQNEFRDNRVFSRAVDYLRTHDDELLEISDRIAKKFDEIFRKKTMGLQRLLLLLLGVDIFIFIIGGMLTGKITNPLRELSLIAEE
ncbi:MAG TPA: hypothetical protein EYP78_01665 [Candidatus Omnitrophica bacterium]|nr:hypothetical protein [Candidatus Omnitrophota bacterium]